MTVDTVSQILRWTAAIFSTLAAFSTIGFLVTSNIISKRDTAIRKQKDAEIEMLKPRSLSAEQKSKLQAALQGQQGTVGFISKLMDGESLDFAEALEAEFRAAGWTVQPTAKTSVNEFPGYVVVVASTAVVGPLADSAAKALIGAGIECRPETPAPNSIGANILPDTVYVITGRKR